MPAHWSLLQPRPVPRSVRESSPPGEKVRFQVAGNAGPLSLSVDPMLSHHQLTLRSQSAAANDHDLRGRPRVMGRPCGEAHRVIPKRPPHKGHSPASSSRGAGWSRLKRGAFCAPAAPRSHPAAPQPSRPSSRGEIWSAPGTRLCGSRCAPSSGRILRPSRWPSRQQWSRAAAALGSRRAPGSSGHDPGRPREARGGDRPRSRFLQPLPPPLLSPASPSLPRPAREAAGWAFHLQAKL